MVDARTMDIETDPKGYLYIVVGFEDSHSVAAESYKQKEWERI